MLGGSSAINGMVWVRGQRQDYDHWAQLGNRGWSWQDVLPLFKGMESYHGGSDDGARPRRPVRSTTSTKAARSTTACSRRREHRHPAQPRLQQRRAGRHRDDAGPRSIEAGA
jgi:choline dehydrogenase-like flavoprotein